MRACNKQMPVQRWDFPPVFSLGAPIKWIGNIKYNIKRCGGKSWGGFPASHYFKTTKGVLNGSKYYKIRSKWSFSFVFNSVQCQLPFLVPEVAVRFFLQMFSTVFLKFSSKCRCFSFKKYCLVFKCFEMKPWLHSLYDLWYFLLEKGENDWYKGLKEKMFGQEREMNANMAARGECDLSLPLGYSKAANSLTLVKIQTQLWPNEVWSYFDERRPLTFISLLNKWNHCGTCTSNSTSQFDLLSYIATLMLYCIY